VSAAALCGQLGVVADGVGSSAARIRTAEERVARSFAHLADEFRQQARDAEGREAGVSGASARVEEKAAELAELRERAADVEGAVASRGDQMTDSSQLVQLKEALAKIKAELRDMVGGDAMHCVRAALPLRSFAADAATAALFAPAQPPC